MSTMITFEVEAKDGQVNELKGMLEQALPDTRAYEGCIEVTAYSDQNNANIVYLHEEWESAEHYDRYLSWRKESGLMEVLAALLSKPPTIRFFNKV